MKQVRALVRSTQAAAAAEMALVLPLLLIIMFGSVEAGNYFLDEHVLLKAVRDGSRFAARYPFSYYSSCSGSPAAPTGDPRNPVAETVNVVRAGLRSGGNVRLANVDATTVTLTTSCSSTTVGGIYSGLAGGARIIKVTATVQYVPILKSFGFTGVGYQLTATSQSAVTGS